MGIVFCKNLKKNLFFMKFSKNRITQTFPLKNKSLSYPFTYNYRI